MKKNFTIKFKLAGLSLFFLGLIVIGSAVQLYKLLAVASHLDNLSEIQLPAIRKMTLIDMKHDGLQAIVYKSLYSAENNNSEFTKEIKEDFDSSSLEMKTLIEEILKLQLSSNTKNLIKDSIPAIEKYIQSTSEIVALNSSNQRSIAVTKLASFNESFLVLEKKLEIIGEQILKDSEKEQLLSKSSEDEGKNSSYLAMGLGLILGIIFATLIIKDLIKSITHSTEALSASVHEVQNSSQKMDIISTQLHRSVESQISSITESAAAMEEISAMLQNSTHSAHKATKLSETTRLSAEKGKEEVDKMMNEVSEISGSYDEIEKSLEENNKEINKIVDLISEIASKTLVINDIVFQTKLLSFNASVEAARAGEAGKGFAVVAEEIAQLASSSGDASTEIAKMLSNSQVQVKNIASSTMENIYSIVQKGRVKVRNGNTVALECKSQLNNILGCAQKLDDSVNEISNAITEQSNGVNEVNTAMKVLENATHETTTISNNSKLSSEDLKIQAFALREMIQKLREIIGTKKKFKLETVSVQ